MEVERKQSKVTDYIQKKTSVNLKDRNDWFRLLDCFDKYIILVFAVIFSFGILYISITSKSDVYSANYIYFSLITLPVILAYCIWFPFIRSETISNWWKIVWSIFIVCFVVASILLVIFYFSQISAEAINIIALIKYIFIIIFCFVLIYLIYDVLYKHAENTKGIIKYILLIILFVPSIIARAIHFIGVYLSFFVIIVAIILFWAIWTYVLPHKSTLLNWGYLNQPASERLADINWYSPNKTNTILFYLWINNNTQDGMEIPIVEYKTLRLSYKNDLQYNMLLSNSGSGGSVPFSLQTQKWNIVNITITSTYITLAVNGVILGQIAGTVLIDNTNDIIIGSVLGNGLGMIKNVNIV